MRKEALITDHFLLPSACAEVRLSFQISDRDWNILEKSQYWKNFEEMIEGLEKEYSRQLHPEGQGLLEELKKNAFVK